MCKYCDFDAINDLKNKLNELFTEDDYDDYEVRAIDLELGREHAIVYTRGYGKMMFFADGTSIDTEEHEPCISWGPTFNYCPICGRALSE